MQASNTSFFFISLNEDFSRLGKIHKMLPPSIFNNSKMTIWRIPSAEIEFFKKNTDSHGLDVIRYFDCYYLLIPLTKKSIKNLYEEFFDYISHDYENLIDINRNQENIHNLLKIVKDYTNNQKGMVILDYGCGTGISQGIAKKSNVKIFGFDICLNMREIASKKGMIVWGEKDLWHQPENSIDAVISSYVFHFLIDDTYLKLLYKILKPNGIIVANFHKNKNRDFIDQSLNKIGFKIILTQMLEKNGGHGTYVIYGK